LHDIEVENVDLNEITQQAEQIAGRPSFKDSHVTSEGSNTDIFNYIEQNEENSGETRKYGTGTSSLNAADGSSPKQGSKTTNKRAESENSSFPE